MNFVVCQHDYVPPFRQPVGSFTVARVLVVVRRQSAGGWRYLRAWYLDRPQAELGAAPRGRPTPSRDSRKLWRRSEHARRALAVRRLFRCDWQYTSTARRGFGWRRRHFGCQAGGRSDVTRLARQGRDFDSAVWR